MKQPMWTNCDMFLAAVSSCNERRACRTASSFENPRSAQRLEHSGLKGPFLHLGAHRVQPTTTILFVIGPSLGLYYSISGTTRWNDCSAIAMEGADVFWKLCCIPLSCTPSRLSGSIRGAWYGTPWLHSSSCARMDCLAPQVWPRASNPCEPCEPLRSTGRPKCIGKFRRVGDAGQSGAQPGSREADGGTMTGTKKRTWQRPRRHGERRKQQQGARRKPAVSDSGF